MMVLEGLGVWGLCGSVTGAPDQENKEVWDCGLFGVSLCGGTDV